jgi:hypothetical protein
MAVHLIRSPIMTVAWSVSDVLSEHVRFEVECIDRMYLNVYVRGLQYAPGLVAYVHRRLGLPVASTAPLAKITDAFTTAVHRFARDNHVAWVDFAKGQRKDDVMHEHLAQAVLGELNTRGVRFLTLRMRSPTLVKYIDALAPKDFTTVTLNRPGKFNRPKVHETTGVHLTGYPASRAR